MKLRVILTSAFVVATTVALAACNHWGPCPVHICG